jgi:PadR family transcriptional regulator, regulatory protein PadR
MYNSSRFEETMDAPVTAKAALLQVLISGPGYGLELIERVSAHTKGALVLGQGSVYPALRELEREGLVKSYPGEATPERGGRPRIYYKITAEGRRVAAEQRTTMLAVAQPLGAH